MSTPQYEDGEMCWHPAGATPPRWFVIGWWVAAALLVLAAVGLILSMGAK